MTAEKKRVLFVGEASFLNTGFSNIYGELLPRLVATGKYEIAEFGSYASQTDSRVRSFISGRWKFYGNNPETPEEEKIFNQADDPGQPGQNTNQFGRWKFEKVLSDFRPDIVIDIRDWWMLDFERRSPLRKYFQWVIMPTVDSIPQREEWIATYQTADYVAAYSDFGINSLRQSAPHLELRFNPPGKDVLGISGSKIEGIKKPGKLHPIPLRPGVNVDIFKPMDKQEVRKKWGVDPADTPVVILVQRNQARKRINEAIQAFAYMKSKYAGKSEAVRKVMMILHTNWPDNVHSSDYPRCIERTHKSYFGMPYGYRNIYTEILNTFLCNNPQCGNVFLDYAIKLRQAKQHEGYAIKCPACQQLSARPPNTAVGYTREQLAEVYNMGDILLQMSIAEGCFARDTLVTTDRGMVPIQEMRVGDQVLTHKGFWAPVYDVWENNNPGCTEIKVAGDPIPVVATNNHEIYVSPTEKKRADKLKVGDYIMRPIDRTELRHDQLIFGLEDEDNVMIDGKMHHKSERYFNGYPTNTTVMSIDLAKHAYFAGGYLAEGHISRSDVCFTLAVEGDEKLEVAFRAFANDIGVDVRERARGNCAKELSFSSHAVANCLKNLFGQNAYEKRVPHQMMQAPPDVQQEFIGGYFDGDGTLEKPLKSTGKCSHRSLTTHSKHIAYQYRDMLLRLGIVSYIYKSKRNSKEFIVKVYGHEAYKFDCQIDSVKAKNSQYQPTTPAGGRYNKLYIKDDALYSLVLGADASSYTDFVYNLTINKVDNQELTSSYSLGTLSVTNCGMPVQEAKACGTMVLVTDYAAIAEKGKLPDYEHINKDKYSIHLGGDVLEVAYMYEEAENTSTNCWRAHTSIEDAGEKMAKYLMNEELLRKKQQEARQCAIENYNWDELAKRWEFILDNKAVADRADTWDKPAKLIEIETSSPPADMPAPEFVDWCYTKLLGYAPNTIDQEGKANWLRTLDMYAQNGKPPHEARQDVMNFFRNEASKINEVELLRAGTTAESEAEQERDPDMISALVIA